MLPLRIVGWCILAGLIASSAGGCAQKGRPAGGPPDTTPPVVSASVPASGAVSVPRDAAVTVEFSEPIDRTTFLPNLFVSPRISGIPEVKWSKGDRLVRVRWADSLRPDATYRVTIGARVRDRHNNGFTEAFTFAFSTGTQIDRGHISGRVRESGRGYGGAPTYDVYAYDTAHICDTFWLTEPDYVTQTGSGAETRIAGWFDLPFLRTAGYIVLAVADKNRNGRLDPGEAYGLPQRIPLITETALADTLEIFADVYDTTGFCLTECAGTSWGGLSLVFSQALDTNRWDPSVFRVTDTETLDTIPVVCLRPSFRRPSMVALVSDAFSVGRQYEVRVTGVRDQRGRPLCPDASCRVSLTDAADTVGPKVEWVHLPGMRKGVTPRDAVVLQFDEPVDTVWAGTFLQATDTADVVIAGTVVWRDGRTLHLTPAGTWPERMTVRVVLDSARLHDLAGNPCPAQVFSWPFTPIAASDMGSLDGRIEIAGPSAVPVACGLAARQTQGALTVNQVFPAPGGFVLDLPAGRWILEGYLDLDDDGCWFPGSLVPWRSPEPRTVHDDTLMVRPRFTLEDVVVRF